MKGLHWSKKRPLQKTKKKKREKELPNIPFTFGVIPISLLLVLPHLSCKNILFYCSTIYSFTHTHTHIHAYIHTYIQNKASSYNNPKRNHSSFLFNRAHTNTTKGGVVLQQQQQKPARNNLMRCRGVFCTTYLTNYSLSFTMMVV